MSDLANLPLDAIVLPEDARPKMPPIPDATAQDRQDGRHLAMIHNHYLGELSRVSMVLDRIKAGDNPPEALQQILLSTDLRRNLHAAGTICGQACQMLMMHHNIEEGHMFPGLEVPQNPALTAMVAHLKREHKVVHELLHRLEAAAQTLIQDPSEDNFDAAHAVFVKLMAVVRSHFSYEESELAEAIGYYLDGI